MKRTQNGTTNRRTFNSNEFVFRPSTMSEALRRAGMKVPTTLVREQKLTATVRQKDDRYNVKPSVTIHLRTHPSGCSTVAG